MIEFVKGDLFADKSLDAIGHGVNCAGAMGKGIALEFRRRWPAMYEAYKKQCTSNRFAPGDVFVWDADGLVIFNLATQKSWTSSASIPSIWRSVTEMLRIAEHERQLSRIGIPHIGAGLGGLNWNDVKATLVDTATESKVTLVVFEYEAT